MSIESNAKALADAAAEMRLLEAIELVVSDDGAKVMISPRGKPRQEGVLSASDAAVITAAVKRIIEAWAPNVIRAARQQAERTVTASMLRISQEADHGR